MRVDYRIGFEGRKAMPRVVRICPVVGDEYFKCLAASTRGLE